MQSGTTGFSLNDVEIATARAKAEMRLAGQEPSNDRPKPPADGAAKPANSP
jgi:hypothetical protein